MCEHKQLDIVCDHTLTILPSRSPRVLHAGRVMAYGCGSFHWGCSTHSGRSSVHLSHRCSAHCYCPWAHSMSHNRSHSNLNHTALGNSNESRQSIGWSCHRMCTVWSRMNLQSGSSQCKCRPHVHQHHHGKSRQSPKPEYKAGTFPMVGEMIYHAHGSSTGGWPSLHAWDQPLC